MKLCILIILLLSKICIVLASWQCDCSNCPGYIEHCESVSHLLQLEEKLAHCQSVRDELSHYERCFNAAVDKCYARGGGTYDTTVCEPQGCVVSHYAALQTDDGTS